MSVERRFRQQVEYFEKAHARLHEALALEQTEITRDALIKRFEFTFEMAWKAMYRWLRMKGAADVREEAFEVIPRAFTAGLIEDDASWTEIRRARNRTAHTYDEKVAVAVAATILGDARPRFEELLARLQRDLPPA